MKDNMKQAIRTILMEFRERELPTPFPREIHYPEHHHNVRKAWVLMGMRRSGKTWVAYQEIQQRRTQGIPREATLYINFEDDRLEGFEVHHFQMILDIYFELYPEYIHRKDLFFCFDEIHIVPGWEKFIRRLIDTEKMQICVTGSSAEMLSKELGTTLGGRAWQQEVFPFSFSEFLEVKGVEKTKNGFKELSQMRHLASEYLFYGGFPEAVIDPKELHVALIQGYIDAVVLRDIIKRHKIANADVVQKFLLRLLRQLSAPLSITKIYGDLKSMGLSVGKNSLFEYFGYFEDAYTLLSAPFFSLSERVRQVNPKKIYAIDPGIITAYSVKQDFERASRLENAVFVHLRRTYTNICYYKTEKSKKEVDFALTTQTGDLVLIQACVEMNDPRTRERELSALCEACNEFGLKSGLIITEDHEEEIERVGITIHCHPFWKWAQKPFVV